MRNVVLAIIVVALAAGVAVAEKPMKADHNSGKSAMVPPSNEALQWIDYYNEGAAGFYGWNGLFYMSNLFKPDAGWYPLDVVALEVFPHELDGSTVTGNAGMIDGVAVFSPGAGILARELAVPGTVRTWTLVNLTSPPRITTGNFYGGIWNSTGIDGGRQASATGWTAPPTEPFTCLDGTAAAGATFTVNTCGDAYGTVSAAAVRAQVDSNVPVELMRFDVD